MYIYVSKKIDLDVLITYICLELQDHNKIIFSNKVPTKDILDKEICCIECTHEYSGRTDLNCWDHHGNGITETASMQAWKYKGCPKHLKDIVEYINILETKGPRGFTNYGKVKFPMLTDIISGVLIKYKNDNKMAFEKGLYVLRRIIDEEQDVFSSISGFEMFASIKKKYKSILRPYALKNTIVIKEQNIKICQISSEFYGIMPVIRKLYNPDILISKLTDNFIKYTISLKNIRGNDIFTKISSLEPGWIYRRNLISSPENDPSKLTMDDLTGIIIQSILNKKQKIKLID